MVESVLMEAPAYTQLERSGKATLFALDCSGGRANPLIEFELVGEKKRHAAVFASQDTLDYALAVGSEQRVASASRCGRGGA